MHDDMILARAIAMMAIGNAANNGIVIEDNAAYHHGGDDVEADKEWQ